jgi:hypothetical protein
MYSHIINVLFSITLIAFCAVTLAAPVFADVSTSTNFMMENSTLDTFGGVGTSSSFFQTVSGDQAAGGQSTSTSFMMQSGTQYYNQFMPEQQNWRWYADANNETPTNAFDVENAAPSAVGDGQSLKLRVSVGEYANVNENNVKYALQFSTASDFSGTVTTLPEQSQCLTNSRWCYAAGAGAGADGALISTNVLSDSNSCIGGVGAGCGTHNTSGTSTSSFTHVGSTTPEFEFTIKEAGSVASTVYFFRLFDVTAGQPVPLKPGASYPSIASHSGTLTFSIDGIASSTVTSGVTTDVDTTSTAVPFGSLMASTSVAAAQRLTVTTNAGQGYSIFSFSSQGFVGQGTDEIPPIAGTNQSPVDWNTGCASNAAGCFGYHTSQPVLSGGSTRFAVDDTYAKFDTTPREVDYSGGATTSKSTDIVYKLDVRPLLQSDSYSTSVEYIVVPAF